MKTTKKIINQRTESTVGRRVFIQKVAASASLACLATRSASAETFSARPDRYGVLVDLTRCIGCRRCEAACNTINELPAPELPFTDTSVYEKKRSLDDKAYTLVNRYSDTRRLGQPVYCKIQCMHCDEPACVSACPAGALHKTPEGPVIWLEEKCIGCRYCMTACPFYVPAYEYHNAFTPKVQKCNMCYSKRILKGEVPACATECPVEALTFGRRSDLIKVAHERFRTHSDKYLDAIYGEHEAGGTSWLYIGATAFEEVALPVELGTTPMPAYTRDFLTFVPLVLTVWPSLLGAFYLFTRKPEKQENQEAEIPPEHSS